MECLGSKGSLILVEFFFWGGKTCRDKTFVDLFVGCFGVVGYTYMVPCLTRVRMGRAKPKPSQTLQPCKPTSSVPSGWLGDRSSKDTVPRLASLGTVNQLMFRNSGMKRPLFSECSTPVPPNKYVTTPSFESPGHLH